MENLNLVTLKEGQYLSQVEPFKSTGIPTNTIIHKEVPGCGITTLAYKYFSQHTIICLPNRPVIEDKVERHNDKCKPTEIILGVHKGISIDDIIEYLNNDAVIYKKILTTPEGFIDKVVPAFGENIHRMLSKYFFLLDECERVITDVSYRGKITAPIDLFFRFEKRAMVSATVIPFSDSRFNGFKNLYIEPDYDYSKPIKLIETNNVVESLQLRLEELNSEHALIFLNSTDTILAIARRLDIVDQSHAYCSEESAMKLFRNKFKNADDELNVATLGKYNFLTSRFFSAFDIKVNYQPDVIMITDVYSAPHSILDPCTEVIQIAGRCRNGVNSLTHITNFDETLTSKTREEALNYLEGCFDMYETFRKLEREVQNSGAKAIVKEAIENSTAHSFYTDGKLNHFMVENFIYEERVRGYYQRVENLISGYRLRPKHFTLTHQSELYPLSDEDRRRRDSGKSAKELRREIAIELDAITAKDGRFPLPSLALINYTRKLDKRITDAHEIIGLEGLEATDYSYSSIDKAVAKYQKLANIRNMSSYVYSKFQPGTTYSEQEILSGLIEIRDQLHLPKRTLATMIKLFFDARRSSSNRQPVWVLGVKRDPFDVNYSID